tara:strand:- start:171 stop:371 length:201 start_codon:yes stop_codon:yes gene_type:complete
MNSIEEKVYRCLNDYGESVRIAVLKQEVKVFKSRLEPHDTGHLHTTISTLKHRIEELENGQKEIAA